MKYDVIVIGAGSGGLVVAIGAAKAGKRTLLIERGHFGGDCTNFGCIPSKSLIASAHVAFAFSHAENWGLKNTSFQTEGVFPRIKRIVETIRREEEPPALEKIGLNIEVGEASFRDSHTVQISGKKTVTGSHIVIATGSSPHIPSIPGLSEVPFLTNETVFDLNDVPKSTIFIGGGPIGCELAQSFQRLGSKVSILQHSSSLLKKEEPEAKELIKRIFEREGISLYFEVTPSKVDYDNAFSLTMQNSTHIKSETLIIATGRMPNIDALNLNAASVKWTPKGIPIDAYGRTNIPHIWAIGDVLGGPFFTHYSEHCGRTVLRNIIFPIWKKKILDQAIPRVTFTDPEIASIGILENQAKEQFGEKKIATYFLPYEHIDRAKTEGKMDGFIKIVTKKWTSQILGACIVGAHAGEMLGTISLAMKQGIPLRKLSDIIPPYPTYTQGIRKTADLWLFEILKKIKK